MNDLAPAELGVGSQAVGDIVQMAFAIHTLGLGVTSLDAEQNLTTIAQAHGGTFRRVDVPTNLGL